MNRFPLLVLAAPILLSFAPQDPPATATSQTPAELKARKLLSIAGAAEMADQVLSAVLSLPEKDLPAGFVERFKERATHEVFVELMVPIYLKHFDEADIDGLLAFYESPAGRKLVKAQAQIVRDCQKAGEKWGAKVAIEIMQQLEKESGRK